MKKSEYIGLVGMKEEREREKNDLDVWNYALYCCISYGVWKER